jgi:4-hydroxyphenylpyruvate dioxygenase
MTTTARLKSIHHVEFWVGNARQAAFFYRQGFGFSETAYAGLETGQRDHASYVLTQGKVRFVVSTPLSLDSASSEHLRVHGDGVRDIAFHVDDADQTFAEAVRRGAQPASEPRELADEHGRVRHAAIRTYGDTIHSFISYQDYSGPFLPGFASRAVKGTDIGLLRIDPIVGNVELGKMEEWADWYSRVLGFERFLSFDDKDISTEYSALMSVVMADDSVAIGFLINEPRPGGTRARLTIPDYNCARVQHIAPLTETSPTPLPTSSQRRRVLRRPTATMPLFRRVGASSTHRHAQRAGCAGGQGRRGVSPQLVHGPVEDHDPVLRDHPAQGQPGVRQGELPRAVRGDRARAGAEGKPLAPRRALLEHQPCPSITGSEQFHASGTSRSAVRTADCNPRS